MSIVARVGEQMGSAQELHVGGRLQETALHEICGVIEHGEIEDLDLRLDVVLEHRLRESVDELRLVLVDDCLEVHRPGCERGHIGFKTQ